MSPMSGQPYAVAVTWSEPAEGVAVYSPYQTMNDAKAAVPRIEPHFANAFLSQEEATQAQNGSEKIVSAEACADMGFEWGGVIPYDVTFTIVRVEPPPR